ncbi:MAG: alcohol dehydrogenase catalytic domain-containing protein [Actinobacteria bacterium]|nr:alcohol dehydrogenase catalytic domain-containing protein [Actinomycetota bacterium]
MRMRAAVCAAVDGPLQIREVGLRPPGPGEVLVRITATGVCASDVHIVDGSLPKPMPIVPGHEAAGRVAGLGTDVDDLAIDDPVVLTILPWCGTCAACTGGRRRACEWAASLAATGTLDGTATALSIDGAPLHHFNGVSSWAEYAVVPRTGAIRITPALPPAQAALLGCAVATGFGAVRNAAGVGAGQSVAVIGCGGVGLNVVQAAALAGADPLIAVDRNPRALAVARTVGATATVLADDHPVDVAIRTIAPLGVDHCFEVLGRPATVEAAWRATAASGQTTVIGLLPASSSITLDAFDLIAEKRLVGTYLGGITPERDLSALADAATAGTISLAPLIEEITLDDLPLAVERLRAGTVTARQVVLLE